MKAKHAKQIRRAITRAKNEEAGERGVPELYTQLEFDAFYAYGRRSRKCPNCGIRIMPSPGREDPHSAIRMRDHMKACLK